MAEEQKKVPFVYFRLADKVAGEKVFDQQELPDGVIDLAKITDRDFVPLLEHTKAVAMQGLIARAFQEMGFEKLHAFVVGQATAALNDLLATVKQQ